MNPISFLATLFSPTLSNIGNSIVPLILGIIIGGTIYFYPTYRAAKSGNAMQFNLVLIINLLLGWTLIGWLGCYLWIKRAQIQSRH